MSENEPTMMEIISHLRELYKSDPERFEEERRELIEKTIASFPPDRQPRAQGLQFRLDSELGRYKDPVARMNRMVEIFWEGVQHFQEVVSNPGKVLSDREDRRGEGKVVPLRPDKSRESLH